MTEAYRVPKRRVQVEVVLAGRTPLLLSLYLSNCAESHDGYERPSDLLNGPDPFLPATDQSDTVLFLHRDGLVSVSLAAEHEFGDEASGPVDPASDQVTCQEVEVMLEDGMNVVGTISYMMPEGQRRLQDVLNLNDRFLVLRIGDRAHLINKRRVIRVSPVPECNEAAHGAHR